MFQFTPSYLTNAARSLTRCQRALLLNLYYDNLASGPQTDKGIRRMYDSEMIDLGNPIRQSDSGLRTRRRELQDRDYIDAVGVRNIRGRKHTTFALTDFGRQVARTL